MASVRHSVTSQEREQIERFLDIIEELIEEGLEEFAGMVRFKPVDVAPEEAGGYNDLSKIKWMLNKIREDQEHPLNVAVSWDLADTTEIDLNCVRAMLELPLAA